MDYRSYLDFTAHDAKNKLEADVLLTNQSLPIMVDNSTRLDNLSIQGEGISYNYTLVNTAVENLDASKFESAMMPNIKSGACSTKEARALLDGDASISYAYHDKSGKLISTIVINKKDCL